jgi:predicted amidophosphoribosyltransferase
MASDEKCAFCWKPLKRGEHHICRRCASLMPSVVKVAEEKARKSPHGGGLWKLARGRRNS